MQFRLFLFALLLALQPAAVKAVNYPYVLKFVDLQQQNNSFRMAYMDVLPDTPNGRTIVLLHGKNFNGYYWKDLIYYLSAKGFRVVIPDQVGWGKSDKPELDYSFDLLAGNTKALLDTLGISKAVILGHSMGGMLAVRFSLKYPELVEHLILEDPIGLEDYKKFVPQISLEAEYQKELGYDYAALEKYQKGYYPEWKKEYEQYVQAQYESLQEPNRELAVKASAATYQMIQQQPVVYELKNLKMPVLLIVGSADRTIVGKDLLKPAQVAQHGNYPQLGKAAARAIPNAKMEIMPRVGHIPHIQSPVAFRVILFRYLRVG